MFTEFYAHSWRARSAAAMISGDVPSLICRLKIACHGRERNALLPTTSSMLVVLKHA
jgi:hypothetical protein